MPPSISRTPDVSNQFAFPLEVREIGIPLYFHLLLVMKHEKSENMSDYKQSEAKEHSGGTSPT